MSAQRVSVQRNLEKLKGPKPKLSRVITKTMRHERKRKKKYSECCELRFTELRRNKKWTVKTLNQTILFES